jgi:branched-chain amino acid transport system substrate-binding protein
VTRLPARKTVAVCAVALLALTACGNKAPGTGATEELSIKPVELIDTSANKVPEPDVSKAADPAGSGDAKCSGIKLGFAGALSGSNAALGQNIRRGMEVAIKKHNDANADCQVEVTDVDTEGDPNKASSVTPNLISDKAIIGVLGPAFSGESKAVDGLFNQAGLVSVTASATNPGLAQHGWKTFFRGLANDAVQGPAVAGYIKKQLAAKKVYVVKDDSDYGKGLAAELQKGLGDLVSGTGDVKTGAKEFSAIVNDIKTAAPDLVFYSGYYAEASPFAQQLREGGYEGKFMSGDGTNDQQFITGAGSAAKDAYLSCPCGPSPDDYAKEYTEVNNGAKPGTYSVEGYDLTTILLAGIDAGNTTRPKMLAFVAAYDGQGLARHYKWDDKGELAEKLIWIDQVK